jgi:heme/copper-type cytochrome/quinol oxidase subunit 3
VWGFTTGLVGWFNGYLYADLLGIHELVSLYMLALFGGVMSYGSVYPGHHTCVQTGIRYGMILFIVSEMMLFFWALGTVVCFPTIELAGVWPPRGIVMDPFGSAIKHIYLINQRCFCNMGSLCHFISGS